MVKKSRTRWEKYAAANAITAAPKRSPHRRLANPPAATPKSTAARTVWLTPRCNIPGNPTKNPTRKSMSGRFPTSMKRAARRQPSIDRRFPPIDERPPPGNRRSAR